MKDKDKQTKQDHTQVSCTCGSRLIRIIRMSPVGTDVLLFVLCDSCGCYFEFSIQQFSKDFKLQSAGTIKPEKHNDYLG